MVAARIANLKEGRPSKTVEISTVSQKQAGELLNVSRESVNYGKRVLDKGAPELIQAVDKGELAVSTAATIAEAPKEQQREIIAKSESEILRAARDIKRQRATIRHEQRREKQAEILQHKHPLAGKTYQFTPNP